MGFYTVLMVIHTILVLFLIMVILVQRSDGDGMGGLSGGGANQFLTGRSAANLLTRTTALLAAGFMITSLVLAVLANRITSRSIVDEAVPVEEGSALHMNESASEASTPADSAPETKPEGAAKKKSSPSAPKPE